MTSMRLKCLPFGTMLAAVLLCLAFSASAAQAPGYSGPAQSPGYSGPTSVPTTTVKALLDSGRDDQRAVLRGRIVSSDGGDKYTFDDGTARITVEIDRKIFQVAVDADTEVELIGELERGRRKIEFDVDEIRVR